MPGCAKDIGIGMDGSVWVIGCGSTAGGFGIHKWNGSSWDTAPGGAVRIAVGPTGRPWVVNSNGNILRRTTNNPFTGSFELLPGTAQDIGIGGGNYAWSIGTDPVPGGWSIRVWSEQSGSAGVPATFGWVTVPGGASNVSVNAAGRPWVTNHVLQAFDTFK